MTPEQEIQRANRAQEVLSNEEYIAAFEGIEEELVEKWKTSPARDSTAREHIWLMLKLLGKVQLSLQASMEGGKVAIANLEHKQNLYDRAKGWLKSDANDAL